MTVPGHACGLGSVRVSMNAPVAMATPATVATAVHIRLCHGRAVTRSVTGIASWPTSLAKIANSGPRPGESCASVFSIWLSARRWLAGRLITRSCRAGRAAPPRARRTPRFPRSSPRLPCRGTERCPGGGIVVCVPRGAPPGWFRPRCRRHGRKSVGQAVRADGAMTADRLRRFSLPRRRACYRLDGKEQLGIRLPAGAAQHPAQGARLGGYRQHCEPPAGPRRRQPGGEPRPGT